MPTSPANATWRRFSLGPLVALLVVMVVLSYHFQRLLREQVKPPGPSWSRALPIARTDASGSTAVTTTATADLFFLWSVPGGADYVAVSPTAVAGPRGHLSLPAATPTGSPTSLVAAPGPALFWLGGPDLGDLYYSPLPPPAACRSEPAGTEPAGTPALHQGSHLVGRGISGIACLPSSPPVLLARQATALLLYPLAPDGQPGDPYVYSCRGLTHADAVAMPDGSLAGVVASERDDRVDLAFFRVPWPQPEGRVTVPLPAVPLVSVPLRENELIRTVRLGRQGDDLYLFLTSEFRSRGNLDITTRWAAWPASHPPGEPIALQPLPVPAQLDGQEIVWLAEPAPLRCHPGYRGPLPVAFTAVNRGPRGQDEDVLVGTFSDGRLQDTEFAARTPGAAGQPQLVPLGQNEYYVTWVDTAGFGCFRLYAASTLPSFRQTTARLSRRDLASALGATLTATLYSYVPFLFSLAWVVPTGAVLLAVHAFALTWAEQHARLLARLGALLYLLLKPYWVWRLLQAPLMVMRGPSWLGPHLTLPVVAATALLAAAVAARTARGSRGIGTLARFALWDVVFTCLWLGPFLF